MWFSYHVTNICVILVWLISISYIFNIKQTYKSDTDVISKIILALYASEIKKVRNYVNRNFISLKTWKEIQSGNVKSSVLNFEWISSLPFSFSHAENHLKTFKTKLSVLSYDSELHKNVYIHFFAQQKLAVMKECLKV